MIYDVENKPWESKRHHPFNNCHVIKQQTWEKQHLEGRRYWVEEFNKYNAFIKTFQKQW